MSLTAEISNARSPVARFFAEHLPAGELPSYRLAVQGLKTIRPPETTAKIPWTTLGTAIDLRIRVWLGEQDHPSIREAIAHLRLPGTREVPTHSLETHYRLQTSAAAAGDLLLEHLARYAAAQQPLTPDEEDTVARLVIVAARYDAIFRTMLIPAVGTASAVHHFTSRCLPDDPEWALDRLIREIPATQADDVRRQLAAATLTLAPLKALKPITCAPVFTGSPDVGHAEGDVITGRTLIDIKATITPDLHPSYTRRWFYQLAGYLLLDYDDTFQLDTVGIYLSRQAALLTWPVGDFLRLLGARMPLPDLRAALRHTLATRHTMEPAW